METVIQALEKMGRATYREVAARLDIDPVDPDVVRQQLREQGAMTTVSLAAAVNRNARGMVSVLRALEHQGVVVKNGKGKGVTWSLAVVTEPVKQEPVTEAPAAPEEAKPVEQIVNEIPSFTEGRAAVEAVPAVRDISREIRRTRNKLEQLTKLRDAVRVIGRHRNLVQQLTGRE